MIGDIYSKIVKTRRRKRFMLKKFQTLLITLSFIMCFISIVVIGVSSVFSLKSSHANGIAFKSDIDYVQVACKYWKKNDKKKTELLKLCYAKGELETGNLNVRLTESSSFMVVEMVLENVSTEKYCFADLRYIDTNDADENVNLSYLVLDNEIEISSINQKFIDSNQTICIYPSQKKVVYVKIQIDNLEKNINFDGCFEWTLSNV